MELKTLDCKMSNSLVVMLERRSPTYELRSLKHIGREIWICEIKVAVRVLEPTAPFVEARPEVLRRPLSAGRQTKRRSAFCRP